MGAVDTTYTFTATDTITSAKMNNIIDQTTITTDAIIGTTLDVASGKLKVRSQGITSNEMAANSIVTAAITDSNVTPSKLSEKITLGVAQNATSGTALNFTNIPSWVKKITFMFDGLSTSGTSYYLLRIGDSGGIEQSGYNGYLSFIATSVQTYTNTTGFMIGGGAASPPFLGSVTISNLSGNAWVLSGSGNDNFNSSTLMSGSKTLSGVLDVISITTVNGTDTFDAGLINIIYQ